MAAWAPFLLTVAVPIVKKVLAAIGIGVITYVGFDALKDTLDDAINNALTGIPQDAYNVIALAGFVDAIGIWLSAITMVLTILVIKRFGFLS